MYSSVALSVFTLLCNHPHHPSLGFIFPNWKSKSTEWELRVLSLSWPFCWTQPLLLAWLSWPLEAPVDSHEMIAFILPTSVLSFRPSPRSEIFALLLTSVLVRMLCLVAQLCPTLCNPMGCSLPGSSVHGDFPGKNAGVCCHAPFQGIFPTQESNWGLLHCRQILYQLSYQGSPTII